MYRPTSGTGMPIDTQKMKLVTVNIMKLSGLISEIESGYNPYNLSSLTPDELARLIGTLERIHTALLDVKRYTTSG